jgi:hypothetical protein
MKIFVTYFVYGHEGCSNPVAAFQHESDALAWVLENEGNDSDYTAAVYKEIQLL